MFEKNFFDHYDTVNAYEYITPNFSFHRANVWRRWKDIVITYFVATSIPSLISLCLVRYVLFAWDKINVPTKYNHLSNEKFNSESVGI